MSGLVTSGFLASVFVYCMGASSYWIAPLAGVILVGPQRLVTTTAGLVSVARMRACPPKPPRQRKTMRRPSTTNVTL